MHTRWPHAEDVAQIVRSGQLPVTVLLAARTRRSVSWFTTVVALPLPQQAAAIAALDDARVVH